MINQKLAKILSLTIFLLVAALLVFPSPASALNSNNTGFCESIRFTVDGQTVQFGQEIEQPRDSGGDPDSIEVDYEVVMDHGDEQPAYPHYQYRIFLGKGADMQNSFGAPFSGFDIDDIEVNETTNRWQFNGSFTIPARNAVGDWNYSLQVNAFNGRVAWGDGGGCNIDPNRTSALFTVTEPSLLESLSLCSPGPNTCGAGLECLPFNFAADGANFSDARADVFQSYCNEVCVERGGDTVACSQQCTATHKKIQGGVVNICQESCVGLTGAALQSCYLRQYGTLSSDFCPSNCNCNPEFVSAVNLTQANCNCAATLAIPSTIYACYDGNPDNQPEQNCTGRTRECTNPNITVNNASGIVNVTFNKGCLAPGGYTVRLQESPSASNNPSIYRELPLQIAETDTVLNVNFSTTGINFTSGALGFTIIPNANTQAAAGGENVDLSCRQFANFDLDFNDALEEGESTANISNYAYSTEQFGAIRCPYATYSRIQINGALSAAIARYISNIGAGADYGPLETFTEANYLEEDVARQLRSNGDSVYVVYDVIAGLRDASSAAQAETQVQEFAQCARCIDSGGTWTGIGCIVTTIEGIFNSLLRIILGVMGGVSLIRLMFLGYQVQFGKDDDIKPSVEDIMATLGGLLLVLFSVVFLRFVGVNLLDIVPPGFF